jgi:predicted RND superfamily exporter protein
MSIKEVGIATLFTSVTTAIGFMSLTTSNVQPVIDMGIYTSVGLGFSFLLTYTLFPAMVVLNKRLDVKSIEKTENFWYAHLENFYSYIIGRKIRILVIWSVVTLIAGITASQLRVNSYLLDGLNDDHPQRKAFRFFEANFSGSRPFELSVQLLGEGSIMSLENLHALDSIQNYLDTAYDVGSINSPVTLIKSFNRTIHAGSMDFYKLPNNDAEHKKLLKKLNKYGKKLNIEHYIDEEGGYIRMNGRMIDEGSILLNEKNIVFTAFMNQNFSTRFKATFTGAAVMMDNTHAYIVRNVARGLVGAILLIGIIMGFLFRSWRIVIICLVTNIIPLILTAGVMAFNGIEMRLSTSIIFIIAFGIAVDDTIHFLSKFKHEIRAGKYKNEALKTTFTTTGKAIIVTTMIISGGFLTLSFSDFLGTHYLGVYISLTLFIALLAVLMVLPSALQLFLPEISAKSDQFDVLVLLRTFDHLLPCTVAAAIIHQDDLIALVNGGQYFVQLLAVFFDVLYFIEDRRYYGNVYHVSVDACKF